MKRIIWLLLCLFPLYLAAQAETELPETTQGVGVSGAVGSITLDGHTYSQFRLMPEFAIWKFGFGFDFDLLIDTDGNIRREDWDDADDIINKIYYIRFAQRGEPFYARVGGFPYYTLSHGLIMDQYSNMLDYPEVRQIGAMAGFTLPLPLAPGAELFTSNVKENHIVAGHIHVEPLHGTGIPILQNVELGVMGARDDDQYSKYKDTDGDRVPDIFDPFPRNPLYYIDTDGDGVPDQLDIDIDGDNNLDSPDYNPYVGEVYPWIYPFADSLDNSIHRANAHRYGRKDDVLIYGANYTVPLIDTALFELGHYAEFAQIKDYGSGLIFPGFYSRFLIFNVDLQMRRFGNEFLPGYFDNLYDDQRAFVQGDTILTKESLLVNVKESHGWYGKLEANLFNVLILTAAYQDMYGEDVQTGKSIWGRLGIDPKIIPNLKEAAIGYQQTNVPYISVEKLRTPSAQVEGKLAYGLSPNAWLVGKYAERYVDMDGDNKIQGKDETIKSINFGVEFHF